MRLQIITVLSTYLLATSCTPPAKYEPLKLESEYKPNGDNYYKPLEGYTPQHVDTSSRRSLNYYRYGGGGF